ETEGCRRRCQAAWLARAAAWARPRKTASGKRQAQSTSQACAKRSWFVQQSCGQQRHQRPELQQIPDGRGDQPQTQERFDDRRFCATFLHGCASITKHSGVISGGTTSRKIRTLKKRRVRHSKKNHSKSPARRGNGWPPEGTG